MTNEFTYNPMRHSFVGMFSSDDFTYSMQYKTAFEVLYASSSPVDTIVLPMLYTLRHCIETALKYNIQYFSDYSESKNLINKLDETHSLTSLTNAFKEHWKRTKKRYNISSKEDKDLFEKLQELIDHIVELDHASTSFRYAYDRKKTKHFNREQQIDVSKIKHLFDSVSCLLYNTVDVFDDQTGLMHGKITKEKLLNK